jgi:hypothetical protein
MTLDPCYLCGSTEHAFCGFCDRCHDHAEFTIEDDGDMPLSTCCGASGSAYDNRGADDYDDFYDLEAMDWPETTTEGEL